MLKIVAVLLFICVAAIAVVCIWWKIECEAMRAPCTIEIGPVTLKIDRDAK
jgi:hypothetical protein